MFVLYRNWRMRGEGLNPPPSASYASHFVLLMPKMLLFRAFC